MSAQAEPIPEGPRRKSSFIADLRAVLSERDFRKLFAVRLVAQGGGGIFSAGFAAYVFFSASSFPSALAAVEAFAVLYLPYSLIGPFVGVFIDRWSRRQIIIWGALIQGALVVVAALVVAAGESRLPFYVCVLATLGAGRFFLAALSAATPHVVRPDKLMMANSVAPTCGTIVGFAGGLVGLGLRHMLGGSDTGSAAILLVSGVFYLLAALLGLRMGRGLLGPDDLPGSPPRARALAEIGSIAHGLGAALAHLAQRRKAAYGLGALGVHHALYGLITIQGLLLYRNYFYPAGNGNTALSHATGLVATTAVGFGLAALITPIGTKRVSRDAWITGWLAIGGVATIALGSTFSQVPFLLLGFLMGLSAQCVQICVDTVLQRLPDEAFLGRMFALEDMVYNVSYVLGPAIALPFLPGTGKSYSIVFAIGGCYLAAAIGYGLLTLRRTAEAQSPRGAPTAAARR